MRTKIHGIAALLVVGKEGQSERKSTTDQFNGDPNLEHGKSNSRYLFDVVADRVEDLSVDERMRRHLNRLPARVRANSAAVRRAATSPFSYDL